MSEEVCCNSPSPIYFGSLVCLCNLLIFSRKWVWGHWSFFWRLFTAVPPAHWYWTDEETPLVLRSPHLVGYTKKDLKQHDHLPQPCENQPFLQCEWLTGGFKKCLTERNHLYQGPGWDSEMMKARLRFTGLKLILSVSSWNCSEERNFISCLGKCSLCCFTMTVFHFKTNSSECIEK